MDNKEAVADLLDRAEQYRNEHLREHERVSRLTPKEQEENAKAIDKLFKKIFGVNVSNIKINQRIIIGKTKNGNLITVCIGCKNYHIPHFNYEGKKQEHTFSLLSEELIDKQNIDIELRTDVEEFFNEIVTVKKIQKTNKLIGKLNKKSIKQFKTRYFGVNTKCIKNDMNYWDLVIKVWNELNEEKIL